MGDTTRPLTVSSWPRLARGAVLRTLVARFSFDRPPRRSVIKALLYHGPGQKAWGDAPKPTFLSDVEAIVRVDAVTICSSDLHLLSPPPQG